MLVFTMFVPHRCLHKPNGSVTLEATGSLEYSAPGALFVRFDRSRAISSKMNTYKNCLLSGVECALTKLHDLKLFGMNTCRKTRAPLGRAKVYPLPRKGYPQDALFAGNKVKLLRVNKVGGRPVTERPFFCSGRL